MPNSYSWPIGGQSPPARPSFAGIGTPGRIIFRAAAADSNPAGASSFVSITQPVGILDGDLLIVGISVPAANVTVTPPDESWTQIAQTDPARSVGVVAFWKFAINEPVRWVFSLSSSVAATGGMVAYGGVDGIQPVEAQAASTTSASASQSVPGISPSMDNEELVLLLGASTSGTYTPNAGFLKATAHTQAAASTFEAHRRPVISAGAIAASTVTFSSVANGAALAVVLSPSYGTLTIDDVFNRIVAAFPEGVRDVYDLTPGGDYYKYFRSMAHVLKIYGFDLIDLAQLEIVPFKSRYKLPDWERVFGLTASKVARHGTIPQRQAQVLSAFRAAAGQSSDFADVRAVLAPILGYFNAADIQVLESSKSALDVAHRYINPNTLIVPNATIKSDTVYVNDGGLVSRAGARLFFTFTIAETGAFSVTLTSPNGTAKTWNIPNLSRNPGDSQFLFAAELAEVPITGNWRFSLNNTSGAEIRVNWGILVEGIGPGQDTGGAIFEWAVYADPAHLGEDGKPADFQAARDALAKLAFSHTLVHLLQSLSPYPDVETGIHAAIPDECIPV